MNQGKFALNFYRAFKVRLPHLDTVDLVMRTIDNNELEKLKIYMVKAIIEKKIFYRYKIFGQFYNISVDATGIMQINEANIENFPNALFKIYNKLTDKEKKVFFINVLEAKLVCSNGFCISLATEWIENPEEYDKQDCELKAFIRLSETIKKSFPRLPICIVGDGLYPNQTTFNICKRNNWQWIFTFKEGNLPSIWKEVELLKKLQDNNRKIIKKNIEEKDENNEIVKRELITFYSWINSIDYNGLKVNWCESIEMVEGEIRHSFVYLSSIALCQKNIEEVILNGRLRFKIENEGFNCQKNWGYKLKHKYSETSETATKNYYTCLQIGHMINQLLELRMMVKELVKGRETYKNLWVFVVGFFTFLDVSDDEIFSCLNRKTQARFI